MRGIWIALSALTTSMGLALPALAKESDKEIVGWYWVCGVTINTELGRFYGRRVLTDEGKIGDEDSASWEEANYGRSDLSIAISWSSSNGPARNFDAPRRPLESLPGSLSLSRRANPEVTKYAILRLRRNKGFYKETGLTMDFSRGAAKDLAIESILLDSVLAYGHDRDELFWVIEDLKPKYAAMPVVLEGTLDLKRLRAAQQALALVSKALDAEQAEYRTKCSRHPEYYDPLSEI